MAHKKQSQEDGWLKKLRSIALPGLFGIIAFFLFTEHRAHLFGAIPYVLLLLCILFHLFGHAGEGHTPKRDDKDIQSGPGGKQP